MTQDLDFIKHLQVEKHKTHDARTAFIAKKLAFAIGLLGLGLLKSENLDVNLNLLLYIMPFVALSFDFYILAEDYSAKRIGAFLGANSPASLEKQWESWVSKHRDPFAPFAMPFLTTILSIAAAIAIIKGGSEINPIFWVWVSFAILPSWVLLITHKKLKKKALKSFNLSSPLESFEELKKVVENENYILSDNAYQKTKTLFLNYVHNKKIMEAALQSKFPEYGSDEFFLCRDENGSSINPNQYIVDDVIKTATRYPDFNTWFKEITTEVDGISKQTILIARWLCHFVGYRHLSVHLFIDLPSQDHYTLIQVRSLNKSESPGAFDLPAAGHARSLQSVKEALLCELKGELNLTNEDIKALKEIGRYEYNKPTLSKFYKNIEYRIVYKCILKRDKISKIGFTDQEVAGISIFEVQDIVKLINKYPGRVASGLKESFALYLENAN